MKMNTGLACLALTLLLAGMGAAGYFAAEEDEPMKDPQQYNHEAWQASPYGRSWQAEAERGYRTEGAYPAPASGDGATRTGSEDLRHVRRQPAEPAKGR
ncbi:MAG: hypothetical protein P4L44_14405 [Oryzomonas sp.]|uniref:hypothetical protein n=1 Tax=Oryzomonas sp. TaxID=2855186 RepID=UPI0028494CFF|nr:hypothetical protein [Oryzomonas sp.]MDR3581149.1 hypothetical protein [Oryzomonas sp.]